jgi:surface antigen
VTGALGVVLGKGFSPSVIMAVTVVAISPTSTARVTPRIPPTTAVQSSAQRALAEPMRFMSLRDDPVDPAPAAASLVSAPPPPPAPAAPAVTRASTSTLGTVAGASGRFFYGYCTWWVASKRPIPWLGNAWQWWWNAPAYGFAEGSTPRVGAIMAMGIGRSSPQGHVAYVESVDADGTFTVSEMNWWGVPGGGWGRVDVRHVTSMAGILGFIY